jgi:hypothetical protein
MWSSTTITSSAWPTHCLAKMPMVAEPQPTRMRFLGLAVDDRRPAGLHDDLVAPPSIVSSTASSLLQSSSIIAGDVAFLLAAAGQVVHAAQREHLRAVLGRGDVADLLALAAHGAACSGPRCGRCRSSPSRRSS